MTEGARTASVAPSVSQAKPKRTPRVGGHVRGGGRLDWCIERTGGELVIALRGGGRSGVTIALHVRSAAALAANLFVATTDDAGEFATDFGTAGHLELTRGGDDDG